MAIDHHPGPGTPGKDIKLVDMPHHHHHPPFESEFNLSFHPTRKGNNIVVRLFSSFTFQDLQSEIESHRIIYDRLDGTGRKLLGSLTSQEDAVMLQRRLDEMNSRWNNLKSKSIAIR